MVDRGGNGIGRTGQGMDDDLVISRIDADDGILKQAGHAVLGHEHVLFRRQGVAVMTIARRYLDEHELFNITGNRSLCDFDAFCLQSLG